MIRLLTPSNRMERQPVSLKNTFNWANEQLLEGEWVAVDGDFEITRITDDHTVPNSWPLYTHTQRNDIPINEVLTVLYGYPFTAITDRYNQSDAAIVAGSKLMVTGDGRTADKGGEGGYLARATSGHIIRAVALKVDSAKKELTFRLTDGWTVA